MKPKPMKPKPIGRPSTISRAEYLDGGLPPGEVPEPCKACDGTDEHCSFCNLGEAKRFCRDCWHSLPGCVCIMRAGYMRFAREPAR